MEGSFWSREIVSNVSIWSQLHFQTRWWRFGSSGTYLGPSKKNEVPLGKMKVNAFIFFLLGGGRMSVHEEDDRSYAKDVFVSQ